MFSTIQKQERICSIQEIICYINLNEFILKNFVIMIFYRNILLKGKVGIEEIERILFDY